MNFQPEKIANITELLGHGGWNILGEYRITKKGIDLPVDLIITNKIDSFKIDKSNIYPTVSIISKKWVGRYIGQVNLPRDCYQSVIFIGDLTNEINGYISKISLRMYKPSSLFGRGYFSLFSLTDWISVMIYRFHLQYFLWIGIVYLLIQVIYQKIIRSHNL